MEDGAHDAKIAFHQRGRAGTLQFDSTTCFGIGIFMVGARLAVWGGFECTRVRVGRHHRDQILETGHEARFDDLPAVAALGLKTLRYPILWEKVAPDRCDNFDWSWHDQRADS